MDSFHTIVIDRGNSDSSKVALFEEERVLALQTFSNEHLIEDIGTLLKAWERCRGAVYSSVGKEDLELEGWLKRQPFQTLFLNRELPLWIKKQHDVVEELGCDRVAVIVGAYHQHAGKPMLIVDSGTAITYDILNAAGKRRGGLISAGVRLRLNALHQYTALLPQIEERGEIPLVGVDTDTEMRSGAVWGAVREIAHTMEEMKKQQPSLGVMLTGGNCRVLEESLKQITSIPFETDPLLVLKGLNTIGNHEKV